MARPRDPSTPTEIRVCDEHGLVEFRLHKVGIDPRSGVQKTRWRCPWCHSARNGR